MDYHTAEIILTISVSTGADYLKIFTSSDAWWYTAAHIPSELDVDYSASHTNREIPVGVADDGWGHLPWGHVPWGHGLKSISPRMRVDHPGFWKISAKTYDSLGNTIGEPDSDVSIFPTPQPRRPDAITGSSYDAATDVLTLNV